MPYKLLITASGTGSRLGEITRETNKSVIEIHGKPAISYVLDRYPEDTELIVTLWYLWDQVRDTLEKLYPQRRITFVTVDKYDGPGSSLAYSMLQAKPYLQEPFVFHACDTIIDFDVPAPAENYAIGFAAEDCAQYTTFITEGDRIKKYNEGKGAIEYDYAHIGIVGVHDYEAFWQRLQIAYETESERSDLNDVTAIRSMVEDGIPFRYLVANEWLDTGNAVSLERTKKLLSARE